MRATGQFTNLYCILACLGFGALESRAQEAPPLPPIPPPPVHIRPASRSLTPNNGPITATAVPAIPVPQLQPVPRPVNPAVEAATQVSRSNSGALRFDAEQKEYSSMPGEATANFTFNLTNVSSSEVLVNRVSTSCGCTVAKLPEQPWHLAPGASGPINVTVDLRGKSGTVMKAVNVDTTAGLKSLMVKINIPQPQPFTLNSNGMNRTRNIALAQADRQAVFKGDCVECHVKPAVGKSGKELYAAACAICHNAEHRATMVPDLHALKHPDTRDYWTQFTAAGKINSLMPAFAQQNGGILTDLQISSLVDYLMADFAKDTNAFQHASSASLAPAAALAPQIRPIIQTNAGAVTPLGGGFGLFPIK